MATKMMRGFFFFLSLLLLLLVPLFVLYIPTFISTGASDDQSATRAAQDVTAQVTAILTGLLGFQRSISAWLDKRKVAVSYAQTSAKLKQIVWTLLDKWNDREILPAVKSELAEDLRDGISNARMIASEEQLFYFQNMSYPAIDVGAALKSAGSDAAAIVAAHKPRALARLEIRHREQTAIATAEALIAEYNAMIETKEDEYRAAVKKKDKKRADRIHKELTGLYSKLNAAQLDRSAAVSRLSALASE